MDAPLLTLCDEKVEKIINRAIVVFKNNLKFVVYIKTYEHSLKEATYIASYFQSKK
jgi:hypothetical protein